MDTAERDPTTCKNSIDFAGIYICVLNQIPCFRCNVCPLNDDKGFNISVTDKTSSKSNMSRK